MMPEISNDWQTVYQDNRVHVIPLDDLKPHLLSGDCWCKPESIDSDDMDSMDGWAHNSMDLRELYEDGTLYCN